MDEHGGMTTPYQQDGTISDLSEVPSVQGHPLVPEVPEEVRQDLLLDIVGLNTISHTTLLHHLNKK